MRPYELFTLAPGISHPATAPHVVRLRTSRDLVSMDTNGRNTIIVTVIISVEEGGGFIDMATITGTFQDLRQVLQRWDSVSLLRKKF